MRQGAIDVGNLGGIIKDAALARGGLRPLFTDIDLSGPLSYSALVFRDDFIEEDPDEVADFVQGTARAIRWAQTRLRDEVIGPGVPDRGGPIAADDFGIWIDQSVRLGILEDGAVEPEDLFTNEYNPYANGTFPPDAGPDENALAAG